MIDIPFGVAGKKLLHQGKIARVIQHLLEDLCSRLFILLLFDNGITVNTQIWSDGLFENMIDKTVDGMDMEPVLILQHGAVNSLQERPVQRRPYP